MEELQVHNLKEIAARYAVNTFIQPEMNIGLGTGSTAAYAVAALAEKVRTEGIKLGLLVATSKETTALARFHGLPVAENFSEHFPELDITIDGADELDSHLNLIKGGGGALVREKLVACRTRNEVIVVDYTKFSDNIGELHHLPVMVVPFAWKITAKKVSDLCGRPGKIRRTSTDEIFTSDDGLYCFDVAKGIIENPESLDKELKSITGVVESGLFVNLTHHAIVAEMTGKVTVHTAKTAALV